jgi:hypothetical protein
MFIGQKEKDFEGRPGGFEGGTGPSDRPESSGKPLTEKHPNPEAQDLSGIQGLLSQSETGQQDEKVRPGGSGNKNIAQGGMTIESLRGGDPVASRKESREKDKVTKFKNRRKFGRVPDQGREGSGFLLIWGKSRQEADLHETGDLAYKIRPFDPGPLFRKKADRLFSEKLPLLSGKGQSREKLGFQGPGKIGRLAMQSVGREHLEDKTSGFRKVGNLSPKKAEGRKAEAGIRNI